MIIAMHDVPHPRKPFNRGCRGQEIKVTWLRTKIEGCGFDPHQPCKQFFNFQLQKKIDKTLLVGEIVICSDKRLLWQDSYLSVDGALTSVVSKLHKIIITLLAEVPGAARVNLQPVEHLLFCNQFTNMCPSAFSILGPPGPRGRGWWSNLHQNLPWTGGDMLVKFHHDRCRGLD